MDSYGWSRWQMRHAIMGEITLLFALSRRLCYLSGEGWHFDGRDCAIANLRIDSSSTKVCNAAPSGACGNAAWRLHYFWGEKCPFLLEDSLPRATRARLVKILRTAYKLDREPSSCSSCSFTLSFISAFSCSALFSFLYYPSFLYLSLYYIYNLQIV